VLSATVGQTALLARLPNRLLTVTVTAVPSVSNTGIATVLLFVRQPVGHSSLSPLVLTATQGQTVTLAMSLLTKRTLSATQAQAAVRVSTPTKLLVTGSQIPLPPIFMSVGQNASVSAVRGGLILSATQAQAASLVRQGKLTRLVVANALGSLVETKAKVLTLSAASSPSAVVFRIPGITLRSVIGESALLARTPARTLQVAQAAAVAPLSHLVARTFIAAQGQAASQRRTAVRLLPVIVPAGATVQKQASKTSVATVTPVATIFVPGHRFLTLEATAVTIVTVEAFITSGLRALHTAIQDSGLILLHAVTNDLFGKVKIGHGKVGTGKVGAGEITLLPSSPRDSL
jgi:hypothetical protein